MTVTVTMARVYFKFPQLLLLFAGMYFEQGSCINELSHEGALQNFYIESLRDGFVGRKTLMKECTSALHSNNTGLLVITGKHGSGKSSLMVGSL